MIVLVTGASGFVGMAVVGRLATHSDFTPRAVVRSENQHLPSAVATVQISGLTSDVDWSASLQGVEVVVHAAARVHVMQDTSADPLIEFRRVNVDGTLNLARQAATAGVKRFVFISSIKVNGEGAPLEKPCRAEDSPAPVDPYGVSKLEAEQGLRQLAKETGLEVVIIRPPLIYGPGVKANFLRLMKGVERGIPLPLASINNCRSLVYLGNLVDAIVVALKHPKAADQTYLVCDGEDVSTPELVRRIAAAFGTSARLIPFPLGLMRLAGMMTGKTAAVDRLLGSLVVDSGKIRRELGWQAPFNMQEGLKATAQWYRRSS